MIKQFKIIVLKNNFIFTKVLNKILFKFEKLFSSKIDLRNKLGDRFVQSKNPLIFTLLSSKNLKIISEIKKINKKALSVELTHGTLVCVNKMLIDTHMDKYEKTKKDKIYDQIDYFIKTNTIEIEDAIRLIDRLPDNEYLGAIFVDSEEESDEKEGMSDEERKKICGKGLDILESIMENDDQRMGEGDFVELCNLLKELHRT